VEGIAAPVVNRTAPVVTTAGVAVQTYTQQVVFLGGIFIGAVVLVGVIVPVLGPIVQLHLP
jgi:hypothetical protein